MVLGVLFMQLLSVCHTRAGRALEPLLNAKVFLGVCLVLLVLLSPLHPLRRYEGR
jgi:hypothetical protein